ncbi:MAG: ATP-binding protein [Candidatus Omnitrophota bacterium]
MKQITVISGKGGTGKTILTASFAVLAKNKVMLDCDVDAADLYLLLHPVVKERYEFRSGKTAIIDKKLCRECGQCISNCRFKAISDNFMIDALACEGCALCGYICPYGAIQMEENISGEWYVSKTEYGPFVHAKLGIAEENSGKLVTKIRQAAKELAERQSLSYVIIDGPPGIGCPVIASLSGVDLAVIITEPTLSGIHDLARVAEVAEYFKIKTKVIINKFDLNLQNSKAIESTCEKKNIEVLGNIPFSPCVSKAIVEKVPPVSYCRDGVAREIISIWEKIENEVSREK